MLAHGLRAAATGKFTLASGTVVYSTGSTASVAYPSGIQAGDLLIVHGLVQSATLYGTASGWTELIGAGTYGTFLYKRATGSESGSLTVSMGGSVGAVTAMTLVRHSSCQTPTVTAPVGTFATNPSLTLTAPAVPYRQFISLVEYLDNGAISMSSLDASLNQLAYRTTSYGMYAGWIDTSNLRRAGETITSNSASNSITARHSAIYV